MIIKKLTLCLASLGALSSMAFADVSVNVHDLNKDGTVTLQEVIDFHDPSIARSEAFLTRHKTMFEAADINGDGVVDANESQGGTGSKKKANKS